jgi:TfoX/Sxy family transcriptional regulator of competence genes
MAYDEELVDRVRRALAASEVVDERKMFGGLGFLVDGNVIGGVVDDELIVRVGPDDVATAVQRTGVETFEVNGQAMPGFVVVEASDVDDMHTTSAWVKRGVTFVSTLPVKAPKAGVPKTVIRARRSTRRG